MVVRLNQVFGDAEVRILSASAAEPLPAESQENLCGADFSLRGASAPLHGGRDKRDGGTEVPRGLKPAPHMSSPTSPSSMGLPDGAFTR